MTTTKVRGNWECRVAVAKGESLRENEEIILCIEIDALLGLLLYPLNAHAKVW